MDLHRLALVIENIHLPFEADFSISIRLLNSDWCSAGAFHHTVLPVGVTCLFNPTEESLKLEELPVDMKVEAETGIFSGTLSIIKTVGKMEFLSRGSTVLYKEEANSSEVLMISILLSVEVVRPPSPPQVADNECQTEIVAVINTESQADPLSVQDQSIATEGVLVAERHLDKVVLKVIRRNIRRNRRQNTKVNHPPDPTPPPVQEDKSFNVLPRLQKLSMLDQMITNRERLLGAMTNTIHHSELRRKMEFIKSQRRTGETAPHPIEKSATPPAKKRAVAEKKEDPKTLKIVEEVGEKKTEAEQEKSSFESESSPLRESGSEKSETSSSTGTDSGSVSGSELSTERSVVSIQAALPPKRHSPQPSSSSSIEDPFSPRPSRSKSQPTKLTIKTEEAPKAEEILSPTSQYIKNLREQIIRDRMAK